MDSFHPIKPGHFCIVGNPYPEKKKEGAGVSDPGIGDQGE
jgi:hypothetical protein